MTEEQKIPYMDILNFPTNWPDIAELPTDYWARRSALTWQ